VYILFHLNIILYRWTTGTLTAFLKHAALSAFFFPQNAVYFIIFIFLARMIFMFYMEDPPPAFKGYGIKSKPRSTEYRKGKRNFVRCSNKTIKWRQQVMCKHSVQKVQGFTTFWTHADYNNTTGLRDLKMLILTLSFSIGRVQLKCDGTRW